MDAGPQTTWLVRMVEQAGISPRPGLARLQHKMLAFAESHEWLALAWTGLVLTASRWLGSIVLPIYDDAFITFRYARNLAAGKGLVYHPGEWVLGTTTPGFSLICSVFGRLGLPIPQMAVITNIVLDVAILYLTWYALPKGTKYWGITIFGALFALSPIMTRISVGGMEMNLYLTCSLVAILLYLGQFKIAATMLAALCYWVRPEALILLGLLCSTEWFSSKRVNAFKLGLIASIVLAVSVAAIFVVYKQVLAQSVIAKSAIAHPPILEVLSELLAPDPLVVCLIPFAVWGFVVAFKQAGWVRLVGIWGALYVAVYALTRPFIWSWYGEPIYYAILLTATWGGINLVKRWPPGKVLLSYRWLGLPVGGLAIILWAVLWMRLGPSGVARYIYEPLETWCRDNVQEGDSILAYDIGAIGYYCNVRIYDMGGLVGSPQPSLGNPDVIQTYSPDYLFLNATRNTVIRINQPPLSTLYRPIARFSKFGLSDLGSKAEDYSTQWVQDYILLQKRRTPVTP